MGPAGAVHEEQNCVASCLTYVDGDYVSLALKALRLGLSTIYNAQIGLEMTQDILFGTPTPHEVNVDLGIMDPGYINIVFNGHQPWAGVATIQKAKMAEVQERAKAVGAKGLRVVGSIETGQELIQRFGMDDVFVGLMGIAGFSTEAVLEALGNKLDPLVDVIAAGKIKGIVALVSCSTLRNGPQDWNTVNLAKELIKKDILVVAAGCGNHALEVAGLCNLDAIKLAGKGLGEICGALKIPPVLSFGTCTDTGRISMLVTALADHLDVDIPQLPIAVTAPEWMEQKATIDGVFAVAYEAYTHLSPTPFVTGAPQLIKLLTQDVEGLTGGKIALGDDPIEVANNIEAHIMAKRKGLGLN